MESSLTDKEESWKYSGMGLQASVNSVHCTSVDADYFCKDKRWQSN